jgi:DNA-binding transcriptional ArsR family regulator
MAHMDLVTIYECLCDQTRLRILNLLCQGPLCVCHIQEILNEPQVKVSKHLGYLKAHGMVECPSRGQLAHLQPRRKADQGIGVQPCLPARLRGRGQSPSGAIRRN